MKQSILIAVIALLVGLCAGLFIQLRQPDTVPIEELKTAMSEVIEEIEVTPPAVTMEVQKLDFESLEKLKIRGGFHWAPVFNTDYLILQGHEGKLVTPRNAPVEDTSVTIIPIL